jgi:very-short-patch-repair endonuclease
MTSSPPRPEDVSRSRRKTGTTVRARALRQADNDAEAMMWNALKAKRLGGYKFVRQFPIGPYFADFLCRKHRLVVEIDGSLHVDNANDRARDEYMRDAGFSVIRFWSADALRRQNVVCETILAALDGRFSEDVITSDLRYVYGAGKSVKE